MNLLTNASDALGRPRGHDRGAHAARDASRMRAGTTRSARPAAGRLGAGSRSSTPAAAWTRRRWAAVFEPFFTTKEHRPRAGAGGLPGHRRGARRGDPGRERAGPGQPLLRALARGSSRTPRQRPVVERTHARARARCWSSTTRPSCAARSGARSSCAATWWRKPAAARARCSAFERRRRRRDPARHDDARSGRRRSRSPDPGDGSRVPIVLASGQLKPVVEQRAARDVVQGFCASPTASPDLVDALERRSAAEG